MKLAVISDTHFGDPMGTLVKPKADGAYGAGPKYSAFKTAAGKNNDYLILLGDILDFSLVNYAEAYEIAKAFLLLLQRDKVAKEIIYVPGNHDVDMWQTVEYQTNIIKRLDEGQPPRRFRMSVPGILDDRKESSRKRLWLPGVSEHPDEGGPRYAGLFLDNLTKPEGEATIFNFAYPNVYIITDDVSVLLTHGHYLERYWSMTGEWSMKIVGEDRHVGAALDLKEMIGVNFPLNQLACSGVGQAGPLTRVVRQVQRDAKDGNLERIEKYLDRLDHEIDRLATFPWYKQYLEWITDAVSNRVKDMILDSVENMRETRFNEEFIHRKEVQERFNRFYNASIIQINQLNLEHKCGIPYPQYAVIGHTHQPTAWGAPDAPKTDCGPLTGMQSISLFNTGGWLNRAKENGDLEFCGAEVFTYSTTKGFSSTTIT